MRLRKAAAAELEAEGLALLGATETAAKLGFEVAPPRL